ncbi:MAG: hypothetical protein WA790_00215 [Sulfitobacter sp.]
MTDLKTERAHERAARYADELKVSNKQSVSLGKAVEMLSSVASLGGREPDAAIEGESCRAPVALDKLQRGDVFIAKVTGGKRRPWIVLGICGDNVSAVSMSSGDKCPGTVQSKCRLWPDSWIGTTISLFEISFAGREVTRPYTNIPHIREIEAGIAKKFTPTKAPPPKSLSDIRQRRFLETAA